MNKRPINTATNISLYFMAMIIPKIISFLLLPVLARHMTTEDFGIVNYCNNVSTIYAALAAMGLNVYYLRFFNKHSNEIEEYNGSLFFSMLIWNSMVLLLLYGLLPIMFHTIKVGFPFYPYMALELLIQFFFNIEIIPSRILRMQNRVPLYLASATISSIVTAISAIFFVVFLKQGALGRLFADLVAAVVVAVFLIVSVRNTMRVVIRKKFIREGLTFSLPLLPGELFVKIVNVSGTVIIERFVLLSSLGIFSIAQYFSTFIELVLNSVSMAIEPELMIGADDSDYFEHYLSYKKLYMLLALLLGLFVGVFLEEVIMILFPPDYSEAWRYAHYLIIACVLLTLNNILCWFNYAQLKTWVRSVSVILSSIINIIAIIILAPAIGMFAPAVALIISRLTSSVISYVFISREKPMAIFKDYSCIILLIVIFGLMYYIHDFALGLKICIKILISIMMTIVFCKIYNLKLTYIFSLLRKKVFK